MIRRPYELLARFNADGTVAGCHVRTISTVDGRDYESDPVPIASSDDAAFSAFAQQFSASVIAQRDLLLTQVELLERNVSLLNRRIENLLAEQPWNVRIIDASAFIKRVNPQEMLMLFASNDANNQQIGAMLKAYNDNDWPIMLDSPEMQQAIGYLVQSQQITQQRAGELLRDSSQDEQYRNGE